MKLKCAAHDRRVLVLDGKFAHRTGDMSPCDSETVGFNCSTTPSLNKQYTSAEFMAQNHISSSDEDREYFLQHMFGQIDEFVVDLTRHDG